MAFLMIHSKTLFLSFRVHYAKDTGGGWICWSFVLVVVMDVRFIENLEFIGVLRKSYKSVAQGKCTIQTHTGPSLPDYQASERADAL
jgi:hypothetical protein